MAIYHNSSKIISRSTGRSAVGASAYRSGEKIVNEYDGIKHDYSKKQGIVYSEILLPQQAKEEFKNRATLWNAVEKIEKSKNSQLAREVEVSLPKELSKAEQIQLVKSYVQDNFINNGMCADLNIHDKGDGNPHAHVMLTMRPIKENGEWGAKSTEEKILDKDGNIQRTKAGRILSKKVDTTNWNSKEFLQSYRKDWADKINNLLKEKGIDQKVDHRSFEEQGIEKVPTIHEGAIARAMEKRGAVSDRMEINRQIKAINEKIKQCNVEVQKLKTETIELNKSFKPENNMKELQEYKNKIREITQKLNDIKREKEQLLTCDNKNRADIEKLKNLIEKEKDIRKELGFFKRKEKNYCDDKIDKYSKQVEELEKSLLHESKIAELTKEITEVDKKLDIENKKMSEYNDKFNELFDKEYKLELARKSKGRKMPGIKEPTTERPKIDKDDEFMKQYLEQQRRKSLAQKRNLSHGKGR